MSEVAQAPHSSPDGHSPQLRFPEFSGNWEEVPFYDCLNDILDFRGRTPLKIGMDWGGGNIISLSANNVKNGYIDFNAECHLGSGELYEKWMGKVKLVKNDIVFTMEAPLGKALLVPDDKRYILSQRVVAFKTKDYIDNLYFIQLIWSNKFQNTVDRLSTGSTAKGINQKSLKKVFVNIPLKPEQQKIADFLTAVDNKIELLRQKQELLGEYKKGLMQQIFSQAIRFKADDGIEFPDWEEKKLGGVGRIRKGSQLNKSELTDTGDYPAINGGINPSGYTDKWNTGKNTITISEGGNSCGYINFITSKFWSGGHCYSIEELKGDVLNRFLFQYLKFNEYLIMRLRVGSGLPNIQKGEINNFKVNLPSLEEQTKISNFLSSIDSKIEQVGGQLDESKQFKKALLQQMFV